LRALGGSPLDGLLATEISLIGGSALAWFLALRKSREAGLRGLGFRMPLGAARELTYGLLALILAVPAIVGVLLLSPALLELMGNEPAVQPVLAGILELEGASLVVAVLLASLLGPFLEELLFRGFVQPACVDRVGASAGIAFTALLFASIHDTDAMLPVFALALLLGHLRHRTGGLLAPVVAHCVWNGSTLALALGLA
jgi:membrane protease YdiL (CAAX protease family)